MQIIACTAEGTKKGNVHVQSAWVMPMANYPDTGKDIAALIRLLCDFKRGNTRPWNVVVHAHAEDPHLQANLSKVTFLGLQGYCCKQRNESAAYECVPLFPCDCAFIVACCVPQCPRQ